MQYNEYKHLNLPDIDQEILARWDEQNTFEHTISRKFSEKVCTFVAQYLFLLNYGSRQNR